MHVHALRRAAVSVLSVLPSRQSNLSRRCDPQHPQHPTPNTQHPAQVIVRGVMRHAVLRAKSVVVTGRFHGTVEAANLEASLMMFESFVSG